MSSEIRSMITTLPRPLIVKITCGAEAAERANQGWTVAAMGLAAGAPVTVWLTGEAVWFAVPDRQPDLALPHATPVAELVETIRTGLRSGSAASAPRGVISWSRT
jgi:predicted peroxiredoxin